MVFVLVVRVVSWKVPLFGSLDFADCQSDEACLLIGVPEVCVVEVSIDRILIFCARVICDLNTSAPLICILEEVHIRTLVKSVVRRLVRRRTVEVMNVSEENGDILLARSRGHVRMREQPG